MTDTSAPPAAPASSRRRRILAWAGLAAAVVVVGLIGSALANGGATQRDALDPESVGPAGTRAVARVLEERGIDVRIARDRSAARSALESGNATLAFADPAGLSDSALRGLVADAADVVLLEPRTRTLGLLLDGSELAGAFADAELAAECREPVAASAGAVVVGELYTAAAGVVGCYPSDGGHGLLVSHSGNRTISAVDARTLLANDSLDEAGNAALALGLLGSRPTLVWYVPSLADADAAPPTLGELTPAWVSPAIVLLLAAGIGAAVWRGRRFGPLVAETLPVTVRAAETTVGRGRLYARSGDAPHAAAQLRRATLARVGRALGLGPRVPAATVADAVLFRTGLDAPAVRSLLLTEIPRTDVELVEFDRRLRTLEADVRAALRFPKENP
ncbi:DUF4350 domain-containing protein [Microbacterium sp. RD1]|uniref:DUF4350 domain-containing protein n=1 Tax=Microbacterium sp. RD1 TaxID=3457313 RepID=UPI003FA569B4